MVDDLFLFVRSFNPVGIAIVRNSVNVPMYGLVQFDSISRCITFVEENSYASGSYRISNDCILELNYIRKDDSSVLNAQFVPAMSSDWLCHQCFYYNLSKNETCQSCHERRHLDCTRVSSEGHPYIPGEVTFFGYSYLLLATIQKQYFNILYTCCLFQSNIMITKHPKSYIF